MGLFDFLNIGSGKKQLEDQLQKATDTLNKYEKKMRINAYNHPYNSPVHVLSKPYDGEKNLGELGPAIIYEPWYNILSIRSWQAYLESEIAHTIINRYVTWIMDVGLKCNAMPNKHYLSMNGLNFTSQQMEEFNKSVEATWNVWANSKRSTHNGNHNLHQEVKEIFKSCKVGGDTLVILRFDGENLTVDGIDGCHVSTPLGKYNENGLNDGVKCDENGKIIGYYVKEKRDNVTSGYSWKFIKAYNSMGFRVAFLVRGHRYRLDTKRGLPVIAVSNETIKKIERYKEAAVGSAEERQKLVYFIKHGALSSEQTPFQEQTMRAIKGNSDIDVPEDDAGNEMANTVAATTNKAVFNMPKDSELKSLESKNEMFFKDFYGTNADIICGAFGIPPNVAFSIYNDSFSASRAATKDWDHTITVERNSFQEQFYQPIYDYFLFIQILKNRVSAPGYLAAFAKDDYMITEAYSGVRFTGPYFPHIDPVTEINAERLKLGDKFSSVPLTTVENATERVGDGDVMDNLQQASEELSEAEKLGLISEPEPEPDPMNLPSEEEE